MIDLKALRTLVGVREREGKRLEDRLAAERKRLSALDDEARSARERLTEGQAAEQAKRDERLQLISSAFTPNDLRTMDFAIEDLVKAAAAAAKGVTAAEAALQAQTTVVEGVQAEIRRNTQRMDQFKDRIRVELKRRDQAVEDATDEESEETAAARYVARRRAERTARHG